MKRGRCFIAVTSSITLSLSLFIMPVKAESDVYYPDPSSYAAYEYFFQSGYNHLTLSSSNNVTYNVNLDNIGSNNGNITGTDNMTGSSHTTGTINSNNSTLGSKYLTCTTNNAVSGTQTYSCYFSSSSSSVANSQTITLKMNENTYSDYSDVDIGIHETINQSINTDITGTISASEKSNSYINLPWLSGTYDSTINDHKAAWMNPSHPVVYFIFCTSSRIRDNGDIISNTGVTITTSNSLQVNYSFDDSITSGLYINVLKVERISGWGNMYPVFNNLNNQTVLPLFYGFDYQLPDDVALLCGIRKSTNTLLTEQNTLLETGNNNTSSSVNNGQNANNQVNNKINQFDQIENNSVDSMNSTLQNLNTTPDILGNSKFLSSAQWVKTQFDRMTVSTPVGSVLSFSLILGITLIFMGKIR